MAYIFQKNHVSGFFNINKFSNAYILYVKYKIGAVMPARWQSGNFWSLVSPTNTLNNNLWTNSLYGKSKTDWKAPITWEKVKPDSPEPVGRFWTPSHRTGDPASGMVLYDQEASPGGGSDWFAFPVPHVFEGLSRGLASVLPLMELWWAQQSLTTLGIREMAAWEGRCPWSSLCSAPG